MRDQNQLIHSGKKMSLAKKDFTHIPSHPSVRP
nr:MAG TPA_asm: hypothetical protein [Caudoviricetes sp.]